MIMKILLKVSNSSLFLKFNNLQSYLKRIILIQKGILYQVKILQLLNSKIKEIFLNLNLCNNLLKSLRENKRYRQKKLLKIK